MHELEFEKLTVKQAGTYSLPLVKKFYKTNNMRAQAPKGDAIFIVTHGTRLVAAVRLSPNASSNVSPNVNPNTIPNSYGDDYLLRSLCVSAEMQRQGIGSYLLNQIQNKLNKMSCYCFPYTHLTNFYKSAGFVLVAEDVASDAIRERFQCYRNNGKDIVLMKHQSSN